MKCGDNFSYHYDRAESMILQGRMWMVLDINTVFLICVFMNVILMLYLLVVARRSQGEYRGIPQFICGMLLGSLGYLTVLFQGKIAPALSVLGANVLTFSGVLLVYLGFFVFLEQRNSGRILLFFGVMTLLLLLEQYYFYFIQPRLTVRILFVTVFMSTPVFLAFLLFLRHRREIGLAGHFLAISFIMQLLLVVTRLFVVLAVPPRSSILESGGQQWLGLIILPLTTSTWPFGFSLMIAYRRQRRAEQGERDKEVLLKELYHRVGNTLQLVSSLLQTQMDRTEHQIVRHQIQMLEDRINVIGLVYRQLRSGEDPSLVSLKTYVSELVGAIGKRFEGTAIVARLEVEDIPVVYDAAIPIGFIINELVTNAYAHAFPEMTGEIFVSLAREGEERCRLEVRDTGKGFAEGMRTESSGGFGLQIVRLIAENQLSGAVAFASAPGISCTIDFSPRVYSPRV